MAKYLKTIRSNYPYCATQFLLYLLVSSLFYLMQTKAALKVYGQSAHNHGTQTRVTITVTTISGNNLQYN